MNMPGKYVELSESITKIFQKNNATWGYRKIWNALQTSKKSVFVSEKVVRNIMRDENL